MSWVFYMYQCVFPTFGCRIRSPSVGGLNNNIMQHIYLLLVWQHSASYELYQIIGLAC